MVRWRQGVVYGQWKIHESDFLKIQITVPGVEEQKKIGRYLDKLDQLITLHQWKCRVLVKNDVNDWEQRKVSELADDIYGGGTPKTSVEEYWNGTIPWIQSSDITEHDVNSINPKKFISDRAVNKSATKLVPENSIAIVTRVGVGKLVIMPFSYTTSQDFLSLSKLNSDLPFTAYLLYKKMQDELHSVQGTSIKGITKEELLSKEVMITQIEEQKKIGTYFSELDHLITLHQWKCRVLVKNDVNDWEQRKLGEVADIVGGGTPSTHISDYWDGNIDWYAPAEISDQIYLASSQRKITMEGYNNSSAKMLPKGTVLFTSRAGIGKTAILSQKGCTNQGFQSIVPHEDELDSYFIFSRTEELKHYGETVGSGSTFVEVSGKQMENMDLMMPKTIKEQKKIGAYFASLDHFITLHQWKCLIYAKIEIYDKNHRKLIKIVIIFEFILVFIFAFMLIHIRMFYFSIRYILLRFN